MTTKQIQKREDEIYYRIYQGQCRIPENRIREFTEEEKRELKELSCRRTINSNLCYGDSFYEKYYHWVYCKGYQTSSQADEYIEVLGEETVARLYEEQRNDFTKATVLKNIATSEGVSYNSIVW